MREISVLAGSRECVHIKASKGLGSTSLLLQLEKNHVGVYSEPRPISCIAKSLSGKKSGPIADMLSKVIFFKKVLLLNDSELITPSVKRFVEKLMSKGLIVITAGRRNAFSFRELSLRPLSFTDSCNLAFSFVRNRELARIIASEVGGYPARLVNVSMKAVCRKDLRTVRGFNDFNHSLVMSSDRHDLIPFWIISVVASCLLSIKFLFYSLNIHKEGYIAGFIAYALMAVLKLRKGKVL